MSANPSECIPTLTHTCTLTPSHTHAHSHPHTHTHAYSQPHTQPLRMTNLSKKEYRQATHLVHMEQERWKRELQKFKTSSHPLPPPTTPLHTPHRGKCGRREWEEGSQGSSNVSCMSDGPHPIRGYTSLHVHIIPRLHLRTICVCVSVHVYNAHLHL